MIRARIVLPLALGALCIPCALADQVVLQASKDNTIFSSGDLISDGAGPHMYVGQTNFAGARRALIAFDILSAVPEGSNIDSALLSFNVSRGHGNQTITLHRLLQDWGEGSSNSGDAGGAGAPAADGDATWQFHHYSILNQQPWNTPGGDFVSAESASGTAAATTFELSSMNMAADVQLWRNSPATSFGWILIGSEDIFGGADRLDSRENSNVNFRPTLTLNFTPPPPQWNLDADGSWANPANWSNNSVPDGPTAVANFLGKITAPRTITLDGDKTVQSINFASSNHYTIAPGTPANSTLTVGQAGGQGSISSGPGGYVISAKVIMPGATSIDVAGDGAVVFTGGVQIGASQTATKSGDGLISIDGPQTHQPGAALIISNGGVFLGSNAGAPATTTDAAQANLSITLNGAGGVGSFLVLNSSQDLAGLEIVMSAPEVQQVDLNSTQSEFNALRIHAGDLDAAKASLSMAISNAGITSGDGIIDSGLHPSSAIGIATLTDAHGDPYLLIRPTRIGDLNLDGQVTISDFIDLASHFNGAGFWQDGDLNGDRLVTISDFIDLASNFGAAYAGGAFPISAADQLALDSFAADHGITLVPEPSMFSLLFLAGALLSRRRHS
jgi:hypothetical protein